MSLNGKTIALLVAPRGTEEPEFAEPKRALTEAGAEVVVIGLEAGKAQTVNHDLDRGGSYPVDETIDAVAADRFDGLVVPGGCVGADKLRASPPVIDFVKAFVDAGKPVGVICHAPWVLIEAGAARGRTFTSFPTLRTDIENAGGTWIDEEVVVSGNVVTSRNPDDLPAFCAMLLELFARQG